VLAVPIATGDPPAWLLWPLLLALGLFLVFGLGTLARWRRCYRIDARGISVFPGTTRLEWAELDALELCYYSTRRDGRDGWMELRLRAGAGTVRVDSRLSGFECVLSRSVRAARERSLQLTPPTRANLRAVGLHGAEAVA
jgi:hypothetical protein